MTLAAMAHVLIDGSFLEGGGQILRNAVSLSALLHRPVTIDKIRHGRTPPGLKNQHRTGLELATEIASAELTGAVNGSTHIAFSPGRIKLPGEWTADPKTAGSTTLLLQVSLPLLLFAPEDSGFSTLYLKGGTNATQAPQIDYTKHIFLPFLRKHFGIDKINLEIRKRGYFPRGGGEVVVRVSPLTSKEVLRGFSLTKRGAVRFIAGSAHCARMPGAVGREMAEGAKRRLDAWGGLQEVSVKIDAVKEPDALTGGFGGGIVLWAELEGGGIIGGSATLSKGKSGQQVGEEAANELVRGLEADGCVDEWLQDQIIIFMALAQGSSSLRCGRGGLTLHTQTAIWLAQQLTDARFEVAKEEDGTTIVNCEGIGYGTIKGENQGRDDIINIL